jgi:branched-chain amino acid transport system permease protein
MNIQVVPSILLNGVAMGMIYALMAMGIIILVRAIGVLNFAQGDFLMLGAYIALALLQDAKLPLYVMIPTALICFAVVGLIFMLLIYFPLRNASYPAAMVIATIGTSIVIKELVTLIWGSWPKPMDSILMNKETGGGLILNIGSISLQWQMIIVVIVGAFAVYLVFTLFEKMYAGRMMEAAAQDSYAAELLGIPVLITVAVSYMISISLASVGGYLVAPMFTVNTSLGTLQLRAFAGVIIGGLDNIKGAVIGSLIIGVWESFCSVWFLEYKDACVFLMLLIFLIFRPQGIIKTKIADKA